METQEGLRGITALRSPGGVTVPWREEGQTLACSRVGAQAAAKAYSLRPRSETMAFLLHPLPLGAHVSPAQTSLVQEEGISYWALKANSTCHMIMKQASEHSCKVASAA